MFDKNSLKIETYQITPSEIPTKVAITCTQIVLRAMNGLLPTCSTFFKQKVVGVVDSIGLRWKMLFLQSRAVPKFSRSNSMT